MAGSGADRQVCGDTAAGTGEGGRVGVLQLQQPFGAGDGLVGVVVFHGCPLCRGYASRRTEAVEAGGKISPLGIAKSRCAAAQGVGRHWRPNGRGQVRAGLHHDEDVRCPGDGETEVLRLQAETGTALHLRIPEQGRTAGERRLPAEGIRQVVNRRVDDVAERIRADADRDVPREADAGQPATPVERLGPDDGDAAAERDARQAETAVERPVADVGDAAGERDAGQPATVLERSVADAGDGEPVDVAGDVDVAARACVTGDGERRAVHRVGEGHRGGRPAGERLAPAAGLRRVIDVRRGKGECVCARARRISFEKDAPQALAVEEHRVPDVGDAAGKRDAVQAGAAVERRSADAGDAVAENDAG